MNTSAQRPVERWLGNYSGDHLNPTNQIIHLICVPAIGWSVIALIWLIPVPVWLGQPGFWAGMAMVLTLIYYWRLSRALGLGMLLVFAVLALLTRTLYTALGGDLPWLALGVFVLAWIGQFIGHMIEGRKPSFFTDLAYLLIGPLWTLSKAVSEAGAGVLIAGGRESR